MKQDERPVVMNMIKVLIEVSEFIVCGYQIFSIKCDMIKKMNAFKLNKLKEQMTHKFFKTGLFLKKDQTTFEKQNKIPAPSDDTMIALNIRPETFSILSLMYPMTVAVVSLIMYVLEGRISGYLPTMSETGTEYPNNDFFSHCMSTGSLTTYLTMFYYTIYFQLRFNVGKKFSILLHILSVTSSVGVAGVGFNPINEHHHFHFFFAGMGFASCLFYEGLMLHKQRKIISTLMYWTRLSMLLIAMSGFFVFGVSEHVFDLRYDITISFFGEWLLLFFLFTGMVTWRNEMNSVKVYVVMLEEDEIEIKKE